MAEEIKNEAAKHLLRLGNASLAPASSIGPSPQLQRARGIAGSSSNRKKKGPFRNLKADQPIREFPVVQGQFDDAPEPPTLPPLRSIGLPATRGGTSGYFYQNVQSGRAPIAPNFPPPCYKLPLTSNPPGIGAMSLSSNGQNSSHFFPSQHYNPSIGRGTTNPNQPPSHYREESHPHSNLNRLQSLNPTGLNPLSNSTALATTTQRPYIKSRAALQQYSHAHAFGTRPGLQPLAPRHATQAQARSTGVNPSPNITTTGVSAATATAQQPRTSNTSNVPTSGNYPGLHSIAPRPIAQARSVGLTSFDAPQQQQPQSRNNNASEKKRGCSQSYETVLGTRRDKNMEQQQQQQQPLNAAMMGNNHNIVKHPSPILMPDSSVPYNQRIPAMPYVPSDTAKTYPITESELRDRDVLMGRGGLTNQNVGNIWFRDLISHYRMAYCTVAKGQKRQLAVNIRNFVRTCSGRFLESDKNDKKWYECGDDRAVLKVGQALREGTAVAIRKLLGKSDLTDGDDDDKDKGRADDEKDDEENTNASDEGKDRESKRQRLR
jgi:hypothetical protein